MREVQPIRDVEKIEEIKNYLRRKSYRNYFLFEMGINVGLRIGDLLKLKVKDVAGKTHIIIREEKTKNVKGKGEKKFKINDALRLEIKEYTKGMSSNDYLFPSRTGQGSKPISRIMAYYILKDAANHVGFEEMGTHTLRKTFGYHFYKQYKDVALLQRMFNHSSPSITLRYIGISQDEMDRAIDGFNL